MENANIQAVIFDVDGLMFDTERVGFLSWDYSKEVTGYDLPDALVQQTVGRTIAAIEELFRRELPEDAPVTEIMEAANTRYHELLENGEFDMKPGLLELLEWVEEQGLPLALATSARRHNTLKKLEVQGMTDRFQKIVTSEDIVHGKPAPDIFLKASEALGVAPGVALVLEDSNPGARAAAAAGCPCIVVPDLLPVEADVQESVEAVMTSLHEVLSTLKSWMPEEQ